jgi:hypothetical protein
MLFLATRFFESLQWSVTACCWLLDGLAGKFWRLGTLQVWCSSCLSVFAIGGAMRRLQVFITVVF